MPSSFSSTAKEIQIKGVKDGALGVMRTGSDTVVFKTSDRVLPAASRGSGVEEVGVFIPLKSKAITNDVVTITNDVLITNSIGKR